MTKNEVPPFEITILVLPRASILEVASVLDPLRNANRQVGRAAFRWRIVSPDGAPVPLTCGIELPSDGAVQADLQGDLLMIIAGYGQEQVATPALISKLRRVAGRFRMVGGVDAGPWIMARAGLLRGHRATVHWEDLEDFAVRFPEIEVCADRVVVSGTRVTIGGAVPAADYMLDLIALRLGRQVAGQVADSFLYDRAGDPSRPQRPGLLPGATDRRVSAALSMMAATIDEPLPIDTIAARVGLGRRRLEQIFEQALGKSPAQAYRTLRLQAAQRLMSDTTHTPQEIALRTGFPDRASFTRAYRAFRRSK